MLPTSTNVRIDIKTELPSNVDAIVVFAAEGGKISGDTSMVLKSAEFESALRLIRAGAVRGKAREVEFDLLEDSKGRVRRIYVAGLGSAEKMTAESARQAAGAVMRMIRKHRLARVAVVPAVVNRGREAVGTEAMVTGLLLSAFEFAELKGTLHEEKQKKEEKPREVLVTILSSKSAVDALRASAERAQRIADAQNFARTVAFRPGNLLNPPELAKVAQSAAKDAGLKCRVLDEKQMKQLGMGGILAVGAGSHTTPPRMIVLEWKPKRSVTKPLLLVGKAITFDTGGVSIKPAPNMGKMVFDKCGAMAVLGTMVAVARLKVPVHVVGILSAAENHVSATAYRPGDIIRMYNGVTVEVTNTDAEGRLVLGDALAWGIETYKPAAAVDLATLTGAMVIALGHTHCGVMSNNDKLVEELRLASESAGEKIWRLPLEDEHRDLMKSEVADIVNSASRDAGSIKGAAFVSFFVPKDGSVPWCHMDIAGVADTEKELAYYGKGATGWGVRTLLHWIESRGVRA